MYGIFIFLDEYVGFILSYFPFYYFAKVCFLIWLFNPVTQGATKLYNVVLGPLYKRYKIRIDDVLRTVETVVKEMVTGERASSAAPKVSSPRKVPEEIKQSVITGGQIYDEE